MQQRRWWAVLGVAALMALPVCAFAQTATFTDTPTVTPTSTSTATPSPMIFYNRDGGVRPIRTPLTVGDPACVVTDKAIGVCRGHGATITTAAGATMVVLPLEEEVATVAAAAEVTTTATAPVGSTLERCLVRTNATVTTSGGGGYMVGIAGAEDLFSEAVSGTVGETNAADTRFPASVPIYAATAIVLTPVSGTFSDDTGRVRVSCFYVQYGAPTQ